MLFDIDKGTAHTYICCTLLGLAPVVFAILHFGGQKAEYGRYSQPASGIMAPVVPGRMDWFLHATSLLSVYVTVGGSFNLPTTNMYILGLFVVHYLWRSIGFATMVKNPKPMSVPLALSTSGFCLLNGWLQSYSVVHSTYEDVTLARSSLQFYGGVLMFFIGWYINVSSDWTLIHLRKDKNDHNYYIPRGGVFEYVSGANFLGEIIEWCGFAVASRFSLASVTFFVFTAANLAPRAYQHHRWYMNKFKEEYPKKRCALIPYVW